jgi:hypothetical protein
MERLPTPPIVRYCDRTRKPWQLHARIVRLHHRIPLDRTRRSARTFDFFAAMHAAHGGGKMSRDCCFKCAVNKHKHLSAVKDRQ